MDLFDGLAFLVTLGLAIAGTAFCTFLAIELHWAFGFFAVPLLMGIVALLDAARAFLPCDAGKPYLREIGAGNKASPQTGEN